MTPAEMRLGELVEAHGGRVLAYLGRRTTPTEDAADLYQEVLTTTWRKIHGVPDGDEASLCWMLAVARRQLANHRRGSTRRVAATDRLRAALAQRPHEDTSAADRVHQAIDALPAEDRELITLVYWDGLTSDQAAKVAGISAAATRKRIQRARQRLAPLLEQTECVDRKSTLGLEDGERRKEARAQ